jgi:enamine deaminase RidA (YjgF/YER057c/UK114 family)
MSGGRRQEFQTLFVPANDNHLQYKRAYKKIQPCAGSDLQSGSQIGIVRALHALNKGHAMPRRLISSGSPFEEIAGYSRAVVDGSWVFVAGTSGFSNGQIADGVDQQTEQAFATIAGALGDAGATLKDVVRVRVYLTDSADFETVAKICGKHFQGIRPANTTIVCGLVDPRMKVEIEVTALKG